MAGKKNATTFAVQQDLIEMLDEATARYNLASRDKALRCILDYVAEDGNWDEIFGQYRCLRCGGMPGWTADS